MKTSLAAALAATLACAAARAELSEVSPSAFVTRQRAEVAASPADAWKALVQVERWWNGAHTYSGRSANLSLDAQAGGCFCERWDGGSVQHGRVVFAAPGKLLRLDAALGPLQDRAVAGLLAFSIGTQDGRTVLAMSYRVRGAEAELDKIGPAVDKVMAGQFARLAAFVDGKAP